VSSVLDSEFYPFRDFSLGVQERRVQSKHDDQMIMTRVEQFQHDGSLRRLAWDSRNVESDNSKSDTNDMTIFHFKKFTLDIIRIGCVEEWYFEELPKFL